MNTSRLPEELFPPRDAAPREANDLNSRETYFRNTNLSSGASHETHLYLGFNSLCVLRMRGMESAASQQPPIGSPGSVRSHTVRLLPPILCPDACGRRDTAGGWTCRTRGWHARGSSRLQLFSLHAWRSNCARRGEWNESARDKRLAGVRISDYQ